MSDPVGRLREALRGPLPGHDHFLEISGYRRPDLAAVMRQDPPPRESAVLALLYPKDGMIHTLLMLRPTYEGVHSAQISFPGGKRESGDASLMDTALREFGEETGAVTSTIEILGSLTQVYIPPSRALVTPYLGYAERVISVAPDPQEVAQLIETPLELLLSAGILKRREQYIPVLKRNAEIPYFDVQGHVVWGATAMMIAELRALLGRTDAERPQEGIRG